MVTTITIILIVAIVAVYLIILKRNGWLGESCSYRCPNPQCKKIFQTPVKVKDFSNKKEVYLACPECGFDLGSLNDKKGLGETTFQSGSEVTFHDSALKQIETGGSTTNNESKEPNIIRAVAPIVESEENKNPPECTPKGTPKSTPEEDPFLKQKLDALKKDRPVNCNNYLGYLRALPKGTKTPDECYCCLSLVECYTKASD